MSLPCQNEVKNKIALATNSSNGSATPETTRRNQLKAELDALRGVQGDAKQKRSKIFDDLKRLRDDIAKKVRPRCEAGSSALGWRKGLFPARCLPFDPFARPGRG